MTRMTRALLMLGVVLVTGARAHAQTLEAQRFRLAIGPCVISSGSGAPSASAGVTCDTYFNTGTGDLWVKIAGTWKKIGDIGSGTPGTLTKWATTTTLQDTAISESGGAAIVNEAIGSPSYASQVSGWQITLGGAADVRYLFTNELRAQLFAADVESVLAGSQRVTKSYSTLAQPFVCPNSGGTATLWVKDSASYADAPVFQVNDWIVIHVQTRTAFGPFTIADCVGTVSAYVDGSGANGGQQSWTFTRGGGANGGSMTGGTAVPVNQLAQDLGVSGNGYVETTAVDGPNSVNAPYMQVVTWTGAPTSANLTTRCRSGNIVGITGLANEYGFLCGDLNGPGHYVRLSNLVAEIRDIPVNLLDVSSNKVISLDPSGPSFAMGNPIPTSYAGANAGLWMGNDGGTYKVRIGGAAGNRMQWDGATFSIGGDGSNVTNINGGNIQTASITSTQIAANTITVGNLLATGYGDNLIKNSTFEGANAAAALAGWTPEALGGGTLSWGCCGTRGPGAALLSVSGTLYIGALYFAVPVQAGATYRVALDTYAAGSMGSGIYVRMQESNNSGFVRYVRSVASAPGDVAYDSYTELCTACGQPAGWTHREYTYTPPTGVNWASFLVFDYGCQSGSCFNVFLDAVEVQPQLGAGHIRANSITADRLVANSITAAQIAAGTITSTQIAASTITGGNIAGSTITGGNIAGSTITGGLIAGGTITGGNIAGGTITGGNIAGTTITAGNLVSGTITTTQIAAGTITGGNIAGGTITAGNIAADTITAGNIAGGTITADKLNVGTLSAISANLGTVTAGTLSAVTINGSTINGTTITAGCATMNSNGISLTAGTGNSCNWYKWSNAAVGMSYDGGSWMYMQGANIQLVAAGGSNFTIQDSWQLTAAGGAYIKMQGGNFTVSSLIAGSNNHYVCADANGNLFIRNYISGSNICQ